MKLIRKFARQSLASALIVALGFSGLLIAQPAMAGTFGHWHHHRHHHWHRHHWHHHHHNNGWGPGLVIGAALGLIVASAIASSQNQSNYEYDSDCSRVYETQCRTYYTDYGPERRCYRVIRTVCN